MAQAPPILVWSPGGGVSVPIGSNPPVYSQADTTALVEGQAYIDIVFGSTQTNDEWVLVACEVENTTDLEPLNIWPGVISERSAAGFRLELNGMPDSDNYILRWAVSGINIEPALATTYYLTGPSSGELGEEATFTVSLPPSTYVNAPVTVTPSETGLETGVLSPESVIITTNSPSTTFTFTPSIYGETTITVNNDRGLIDPGNLTYTTAADLHLLDTLISYWKLDEAGLTRNDSQGTNHLSDFNTVAGTAGKINNCALLVAASSQYLWCASNTSLRVTSDFTFSLWVKMSTVASVQFILLKQGGGTNDYGLLHDPSAGFCFLVGTVAVASDYAKVGAPASTGTWYHLVLWFDSATGQVYIRVNDTTTYQSTTSPALVQTTGNFQLGATVGGGNFMDGYMDEVGFWKRTLTASEITALYNSGAGLSFGSFTS